MVSVNWSWKSGINRVWSSRLKWKQKRWVGTVVLGATRRDPLDLVSSCWWIRSVRFESWLVRRISFLLRPSFLQLWARNICVLLQRRLEWISCIFLWFKMKRIFGVFKNSEPFLTHLGALLASIWPFNSSALITFKTGITKSAFDASSAVSSTRSLSQMSFWSIWRPAGVRRKSLICGIINAATFWGQVSVNVRRKRQYAARGLSFSQASWRTGMVKRRILRLLKNMATLHRAVQKLKKYVRSIKIS